MGPTGPAARPPSTAVRTQRRVAFVAGPTPPRPDPSPMTPPSEDPAPEASNDDHGDASDTAELLRRFVAASGRERREIFKALKPHLAAEDMEAIAFAVRDPSPKLSSRVTALLARHGRRDLFEAQLGGLRPGKIAILRGTFRKIAGGDPDPSGGTVE